MPIKANAKKALRQSIKRARRNLISGAEIHSLRVKFRKLATDKKVKEAAALAREIGQKLDKALAKGKMKKNTVARWKSRLSLKVNALTAKK